MSKKKLEVGDAIPKFELKDSNSKLVSIDTIIGSKNIVIYFYPKNETKVCTAQACSFRDNYEEFQDLECEVIGISSDNEESHKNFAKNHNLPFILLSDSANKVRKEFGVPKDMMGLAPGRYTYVVNKEGKIIYIFNSALNAKIHIKKSIEALRSSTYL